jgi:Uma2 family endonuclease
VQYIGSPKSPTLTVYPLVNGKYQARQFRGEERIESVTFPQLNLSANQVFSAGR